MSTTTTPIEKRAGVCGGEACLTGTRIPVWLLEQARRLKTPTAQLLRSYPTLTEEALEEAWTYASANRAEIDTAIQENEAE
jgi:uncharacterized protein (DUF433 family)